MMRKPMTMTTTKPTKRTLMTIDSPVGRLRHQLKGASEREKPVAMDGRDQRARQPRRGFANPLRQCRRHLTDDNLRQRASVRLKFFRQFRSGRQAMVVDRHPQVSVLARKAEISLDQRRDPVRASLVETRAQMLRPDAERHGVDRQY
jgi:hypothetical protein